MSGQAPRRGSTILAALRAEAGYLGGSRWDLTVMWLLPLLTFVVAASMFWQGSFRQIPVAVIDHDHSALSRVVLEAVLADPRLRLMPVGDDDAQASAELRAARLFAVLPLPAGLERAAVRREDIRVELGFNASYQTVASQGAQALQGDAQSAIREFVAARTPLQGVTAIHHGGPRVQITQVGNGQASFERFLEPLMLAGILHLLLSCAVVGQVGRVLKEPGGLRWAQAGFAAMLARLLIRMAWPTLVFMGWFAMIPLWLSAVRGWPVNGHLWMWLLGQWALCGATSAIAALLVAATRDIDTAFSISTVYAGSAITYSNGTLPILHASAFTRGWSEVLPFTHYLAIQNQQFVMGSDAVASLGSLLYLLLTMLFALLLATWLWTRTARKPPAAEGLMRCGPTPDEGRVGVAMLATLTSIARARPLISLAVLSVLLYGFYYPQAYRSEVSVKLPVAVVDQDHSVWSRQLIRALDDTRAVHVSSTAGDPAPAMRQLRNGQVDGVVVISPHLEGTVLDSRAGGLAIYVPAAWLVRARDIGAAASAAIASVAGEVAEPALAAIHHRAGGVNIRLVPMYNRADGYGGYVVPAVAAVILHQTLLFATAMLIALRREQSAGWRMRAGGLLGCWLGLVLIGCLTGGFLYGFVFWFQDFPRMGNPWALLLALPLFVATVAALGLWLGSFFERSDRAVQVLAGTSVLLFFLGGVSWPLFAMPSWLAWLSSWLTTTVGMQLLVQLSSDGASLTESWPWLWRLAGLCLLLMAAAGWRLIDRKATCPD